MSAEAQLQYEGRVRNRQAVIAIVAGVLVMVAAIIGLTGPHAQVNELTLGLITDHKRHSLDLIAGVVTAICQVAVAATLVFLFRCSKARRPEAPGFMPIVAIAGGALTAICAIVNPIVLHSKVNEFLSTGAQTYDEASRLTGGGVLLALQIGAQLGSLLLAVSVVLIALQSMRVGLLPRPLRVATMDGMEGSGFGGLFGDPDDLQRRLGEFAEQMQGAQRLAWADNAIKLAVDLTMAAINRVNIQGTTEQQTEQLRSVMALIFPEAVSLVREAREGLQ